MNHAYYYHRYLFVFSAVISTFIAVFFCRRLKRESMVRYLSMEYLKKLNIRTIALLSFFIHSLLQLLSCLSIAIAKYSHGYFLNIFSQRIAPAPSLFFTHGNYVLYHFGITLGILASAIKTCFLFILVALFLPQSIMMVKDRSKAEQILSFSQYKGILGYGLAKLLIAPVLIIALQTDNASDFDWALFVHSVMYSIECLVIGCLLRMVSGKIEQMGNQEATSPFAAFAVGGGGGGRHPQVAFNRANVPYSDPILLDNEVEDNPSILWDYLSSSAYQCSLTVIVEGLLTAIFTLFLCVTSNKDEYPFIRDLMASLIFIGFVLSTLQAGFLLIPLKRLLLVVEPRDSVRLTNLESLFWKPSLFLMDREWRDRIRQERMRRLANIQNIPHPSVFPGQTDRMPGNGNGNGNQTHSPLNNQN